ncbi:MAG: CDP-alcohol phosphatidyltransferase family protein [Flavobacteriales bacterium]
MADKLKSWIPNLFTLGNLLCGCIAIQYAYLQDFRMAALLVLAGAVLDFLDGFMARLLKVSSELGKQLDSLADVVTFGVAPGIVVFNYFGYLHGLHQMNGWMQTIPSMVDSVPYVIALVAFAIPVFSAIRLAVFNLDKTQSDSFKGVPTPACGMFFVFYCACIFEFNFDSPGQRNQIDMELNPSILNLFLNGWILVSLCVLFCLLMVSRLPLFALKFKSFGFKGNEIRYIFLTLALGMLIIFQLRAIPLIVLLYILLSFIIIPFNRKQQHEI